MRRRLIARRQVLPSLGSVSFDRVYIEFGMTVENHTVKENDIGTSHYSRKYLPGKPKQVKF